MKYQITSIRSIPSIPDHISYIRYHHHVILEFSCLKKLLQITNGLFYVLLRGKVLGSGVGFVWGWVVGSGVTFGKIFIFGSAEDSSSCTYLIQGPDFRSGVATPE